MEDPIHSDPNPISLPIPPLDFNGVCDGVVYGGDDDDEFLFNLDFDFSVDDLSFADGFLIEPENPNSENPNSSISHNGSQSINPNSHFSPKLDPILNNGPISSEESNFGPGSGSGESGNTSDRDVSSNLSQNSSQNLSQNSSKKLSKRKKESEIDEVRISKVKKFATENGTVILDGNQNEDDDEKRKARLIRNRESAQLSRQRKKQYVEELEDKVRSMHSTINELNGKISFIMAENASLRHQLSTGVGVGGGGVAGTTPPPPPAMGTMGMYPIAPMPYPWMPYSPYMVKPQGSHVPLVPIPRLKPQQQAGSGSGSKGGKKSEGKKKRVASVSLLGLLFFMLLFGGLVPIVNVKYGGIGDGFSGKKGNVYMVDKTTMKTAVGGHGRVLQGSNSSCGNSSEPLVASLYVPRNDKLVKIDGNLIIHSVLASEKAKATKIIDEGDGSKGSEETGLAIHGSYPPYPTPGPGSNDWRHPHLDRNHNGRQRALGSSSSSDFTPVGSDGKLQQWFREGLAGPMLSSGMCTEVFQFDISPTPGSIVPATSISNITSKNSQNSTNTNKSRNRRILNEHVIPLDGHTLNTTEMPQEHTDGLEGNNSSSSMVVSVLVDPREVGDGDGEGVIRSKTMSRIFVVVLIDSVKYVTYSCMLPFMGSGNHLVTT